MELGVNDVLHLGCHDPPGVVVNLVVGQQRPGGGYLVGDAVVLPHKDGVHRGQCGVLGGADIAGGELVGDDRQQPSRLGHHQEASGPSSEIMKNVFSKFVLDRSVWQL